MQVLIIQLRAAHPGRRIVCAFCWPEPYVKDGKYKYNGLVEDAAKVKDVSLAVVSLEGVQKLGVRA